MIMLKVSAVLVSAMLFTSHGLAQTISDTHGNRMVAAQRYLDAVPMDELMTNASAEMVKNMPAESREPFITMMTETIRIDVLENAALASMATHFTVQEINALTDFYTSPVGKSDMNKFGLYMADIMPVIQQEIIRAVQQLTSDADSPE